jgi:hypothetical protein
MRDKWTLLIAGGCLGSVVGVIGASVSDPEVGFPAWVDLTGVVVGFGLGVLTTGLVALLRHAMWSSRRNGPETSSRSFIVGLLTPSRRRFARIRRAALRR